jgi:hypothetical protein
MSEGQVEGLCKPKPRIVYTTEIDLTPVRTMRIRKRTKEASLGMIIATLYLGLLLVIVLLVYKILYVPEPDLSLCPFCNQQVLESR